MARYAIITYSTDMRAPRNRIVYTTSLPTVEKALARVPVLSHGDNADAARNHHHDLTAAYELPKGWRAPSAKVIDSELFRRRGSIYSPRCREDIIVECVRRDGCEVVRDRYASKAS